MIISLAPPRQGEPVLGLKSEQNKCVGNSVNRVGFFKGGKILTPGVCCCPSVEVGEALSADK